MQIINNGVAASSDGRMQVEGTDTRVSEEMGSVPRRKWANGTAHHVMYYSAV